MYLHIFFSLQTLFIACVAPVSRLPYPTAELVIDGDNDDSSIIVYFQQGWVGQCKRYCSSQRKKDHNAFLNYYTGFVNIHVGWMLSPRQLIG